MTINLISMSNSEIINRLQDSILEKIPTGVKTAGDLERVEYLLGKLSNDYVYVITLASHARNYVRQLKRQGAECKDQYEDMMDKRDSLEAIASAVKLQYNAVSRMLTVQIEMSEESKMYDYRKDKRGE